MLMRKKQQQYGYLMPVANSAGNAPKPCGPGHNARGRTTAGPEGKQ